MHVYVVRDQVLAGARRPERHQGAAADSGADRGRCGLVALGVLGALVNSGCWVRQLQPVPAHLGAPPVFVSRFVQTHVRVYWDTGAIQVELWEHTRPSSQRMRVAERLAIAGRVPAQPDDDDAEQRVRARASLERSH